MLRPFAVLSAVVSIAIAAPALADPIDGTWKSDLASAQLTDRPDVNLLSRGRYTCTSCVPSYTVTANGRFQKVAGQDYWDEISVTVNNPRSVAFTVRRKGKVVGTATDVVSADGATLTSSYRDTGSASGTPVEGRNTHTRIEPAPKGAHMISGSWKRSATQQSGSAGLNQTFMLHGDTLHLKTPLGESYEAKLGGPAVPIVGDPAGTMVMVRKVGDAYEETGYRAGKPVYRMTFTPSADGTTLDVVSTNLKTDATTRFTARKQ